MRRRWMVGCLRALQPARVTVQLLKKSDVASPGHCAASSRRCCRGLNPERVSAAPALMQSQLVKSVTGCRQQSPPGACLEFGLQLMWRQSCWGVLILGLAIARLLGRLLHCESACSSLRYVQAKP